MVEAAASVETPCKCCCHRKEPQRRFPRAASRASEVSKAPPNNALCRRESDSRRARDLSLRHAHAGRSGRGRSRGGDVPHRQGASTAG